MKAHHIMTRKVISVAPDATTERAARLMIENHISGLPVIDAGGRLVGMVTERDFLRRREIGTQARRPRWLSFVLGPGRDAEDYVRAAGRRVEEVMTPDVVTVDEDTPLDDIVALMERRHVKRVPVMRGSAVVGIISRQNFVRAVASLAREVPDPTADDEHIRRRIVAAIEQGQWAPIGINVMVCDGVVDLYGAITDEHVRQAIKVAAENVAGVKKVRDHLYWVDPMSGLYVIEPDAIAPQEPAAPQAG
ncbi:MAG: CBS domain-containing protein [Pseudomonadota bacterium]